MVTAIIAEANQYGVTIKRTDGTVLKTRRARLADKGDRHGVNRDDADEIVEGLGYVAGNWRWQSKGSYYKAVVSEHKKLQPWRSKR